MACGVCFVGMLIPHVKHPSSRIFARLGNTTVVVMKCWKAKRSQEEVVAASKSESIDKQLKVDGKHAEKSMKLLLVCILLARLCFGLFDSCFFHCVVGVLTHPAGHWRCRKVYFLQAIGYGILFQHSHTG